MSDSPAHARDPRFWAAYAVERAVRRARAEFHSYGPLVVKDTVGEPIEFAFEHLAWIAHINYAWSRGLHAGIFAPFGFGKSSGLAVPLLTWILGRDPQARIKVICSSDVHAAQRVQLARQIIESESYREVFPRIRQGGKWTEHMLYVQRKGQAIDASIEARGVFTKGVGGRANYILFDDVCDIGNSTEEGLRERVKSYVQKLWMSRFEPGGRGLWIATPWNQLDCSYLLRSSPDWCWLEHRICEGDLTRMEQEVWNAGPDYEPFVEASMRAMIDGQ